MKGKDSKAILRPLDGRPATPGREPKTRPEIFAREQIYLDEDPTAEPKLQALRIGELGVAAIPCEVYGITGLKIKARSPLVPTFNVTLAGGEEGYIPPPKSSSSSEKTKQGVLTLLLSPFSMHPPLLRFSSVCFHPHLV